MASLQNINSIMKLVLQSYLCSYKNDIDNDFQINLSGWKAYIAFQ